MLVIIGVFVHRSPHATYISEILPVICIGPIFLKYFNAKLTVIATIT